MLLRITINLARTRTTLPANYVYPGYIPGVSAMS
jgi:hypothetical protein